ncbi:hypothetical protein ZWY2020_012018 [Hordeum vulgare]|nr:hypothetical protein ZWY2020_012018 [Hordeum vulgare]
MAAAAADWVPTGDGLRLETARAVAKAHGVPLDVVLKGFFVDAVDGPDGFADLHGVEDHVIVTNQADGRHLIKFANYKSFEDACEAPTAPGQQEEHDSDACRLTVVIMPYADHDSCDKLEDLAACPEFGYAKIDIANYDMLLWKKRDMTALNDQADKCRQLCTDMEITARRLFSADKCRRLGLGSGDRKVAGERLLKAHLDAKRYGDAHDLLLLLNKGKHDAIFREYDPCRPDDNASSGDHSAAARKQATARHLERYKHELDETYGAHPLEPYPERAEILKMEARCKLRRELANARREVRDIVETATQEIERIADQLEAMGAEPRLLGCGI